MPACKHWNEFMEIVNDSLHRIIRFLYDLSKCINKNNYALIQWITTPREKAISVIKRTFCRGSSCTLTQSQTAVAICQGEPLAEIFGQPLPNPALLKMSIPKLSEAEDLWEVANEYLVRLAYLILKGL